MRRVESRDSNGIAMTLVMMCLFLLQGVVQTKAEVSMQLTSSVFKANGMIPRQYSCEGKDISPGLRWSDPPNGTKGFALISDDPDAPVGTWVHWVLWNLPPETRELPEGVPTNPKLSNGAQQGITDFGRAGYGGPCPPPGKPHRYFFKLYALDTQLNLPDSTRKKNLENAMKGHILAQAELIGLYKRS